MASEINLSGGEVMILKTLGLSGTPMAGSILLERNDTEAAEFIDTLGGLIAQDYVLANKLSVRTKEDIERAFFRVNPMHSSDLRDCLNPARRRAREDRDQRRRRRS